MNRKELVLVCVICPIALFGIWCLLNTEKNTTCEGRSFRVGSTNLNLQLKSSEEFGCHYVVPDGTDMQLWLSQHKYRMVRIACGPISSQSDYENGKSFLSITSSEIGKETILTISDKFENRLAIWK